jgi:cytochrome c oxidase cbb3-type subunit 1
MPAKGIEERAAFADAMTLLCALIGAAVGLGVMLASRDPAMAFHGFVFLVAGALAAIFVLKLSFETTAPSQPNSEYMDGPIKVAAVAALIWGIACFLVGDVPASSA